MGTGESKKPFAKTDDTIKIKAYSKGKVVFGEYAYDSSSSSATIALPPGTYNIEIKGQLIKDFSYKVVVPDVPSGSKIEGKVIDLQYK